MLGLFGLAAEVQAFLDGKGWRSCTIGGVALQRFGESRLTRDIDLMLFAGFDREEEFIDALLARYTPRLTDARAFALRHRVLLLESSERIGIDVSLAGLPFEDEIIRRATEFEFLPGCRIRTCSAEDLVVLKAFASRPQDWVDIRGILVHQGAALDREAIRVRLAPLAELKEDPEIEHRLARLFTENP